MSEQVNQSTELTTSQASQASQMQLPGTEVAVYKRPPFDPQVYTEEELMAKITTEAYTRRVYCGTPKYRSGQPHYSELTVLQYASKFISMMDKLPAQVAAKIIKQYKTNGRVARTSLHQLMSCIGGIDEVGDGMVFPEESYKWFLNAIAEAEQVLDLMDSEADRLREESKKGNIRYVEKFS